MKNLISQINSIDKQTLDIIDNRLNEFSSINKKDEQQWFSELCFCILTANSKAKTALAIQSELGFNGFSKMKKQQLSKTIRKNKHRFHNNKASFIIEARQHFPIKEKIKLLEKQIGIVETRNWLAENIKGIGYKEASHFLRNIGYDNIAILDRHIINLMLENNIINEKPKTLNKKNYLEMEQKFLNLSEKINISPAKLDLMMWYLKAGEVLK
jgi:N-glycosylase/DNA lyase